MDESFPAKRLKSKKMINRATSGCEASLHIKEQIVGFEIPDKSTVDHYFHAFTYATCLHNRTIIGMICWILVRLWKIVSMHICQKRGLHLDPQRFLNKTPIPVEDTNFLEVIYDRRLSFVFHLKCVY